MDDPVVQQFIVNTFALQSSGYWLDPLNTFKSGGSI